MEKIDSVSDGSRQVSCMRFKIPLVLFLLCAGAGVSIAYDRSAAWAAFSRIVGGLTVFIFLSRAPESIRVYKWEVPILGSLLGSLPFFLAIYFFLTNDWKIAVDKLPELAPVVNFAARLQPGLTAYGLHPNVVGGLIATLLPIQVAVLKQNSWGRGLPVTFPLLGLSCCTLLLSGSRGAWFSFSLVTSGWALWGLLRRRLTDRRKAQVAWVIALAVFALALGLLLTLTPLGGRLLTLRGDRLDVWRNSLALVSDYPFTGLGLGNFEMAYSTYVLLVQVGHTRHAHNLYLDIWIQQGLLGLFAFGWLTVAAARSRVTGPLGLAAPASLAVMLLHGLVDDPFYGYGGRGVLLIFVPFALLARTRLPEIIPGNEQPARRSRRSLVLWIILGVTLLAMLPLRSTRAALQANLAAVAQTKAELSVYRWPEWAMQDAVRRSPEVDLSHAIAWYQAALTADRHNTTASRRLGQIELSLGEYDAACRHLLVAYTGAPHQRANRQLLGECYAISGDIESAAALWRTIDVTQQQLKLREWWYTYFAKDQDRAALIAQAASTLNEK